MPVPAGINLPGSRFPSDPRGGPLAFDCCLSQDTRCLLEGCSRQKLSVASEALVIQQYRLRLCWLPAGCLHLAVLLFQLRYIYQGSWQKCGIAWLLYLVFAQHLPDDHLDVLVINMHTLRAIYFLHLLHQVALRSRYALDHQDVVWIDGTLCNPVSASSSAPSCTRRRAP